MNRFQKVLLLAAALGPGCTGRGPSSSTTIPAAEPKRVPS